MSIFTASPRRTKTYIAFDGDTDFNSYHTFQSWSADPKHPFRLNDAHEINYARDDSLPTSIIAQTPTTSGCEQTSHSHSRLRY